MSVCYTANTTLSLGCPFWRGHLSIKEVNIALGTGIMPILFSYLSQSEYLFSTWFTNTLSDIWFWSASRCRVCLSNLERYKRTKCPSNPTNLLYKQLGGVISILTTTSTARWYYALIDLSICYFPATLFINGFGGFQGVVWI